jgi:proteic killer suppression protein
MYDYSSLGGNFVIASFGDASTKALYDGSPKKDFQGIPPSIHAVAVRKLDMISAATTLGDLQSPPGNRLEALVGNLEGIHSIRVNDQWRIVFRWQGSDAFDVQITDYH